jgi:hypothetical protein
MKSMMIILVANDETRNIRGKPSVGEVKDDTKPAMMMFDLINTSIRE